MSYFRSQGTLAALPGTGKEQCQIDEILKAKSFEVKLSSVISASEEKIKAMKNSSFLHIGILGFYEKDSDQKSELELGFKGVKREKKPLLKSVLLF